MLNTNSTLEAAITEVTGIGINEPVYGKELSDLLMKASVDRELALASGSADTLEIEAVFDVKKSEWTVQLHDASSPVGCSLYQMN